MPRDSNLLNPYHESDTAVIFDPDIGLGRFQKFKTLTPNLTPEVGVVTPELTPGGCVIFMTFSMIYIKGCVMSSLCKSYNLL